MKQTDKQFMALIGHDILVLNLYGALGKAKVLGFVCDGGERSLRLDLECGEDYKNVKMPEWALEYNGHIRTSENTIEAMEDIEGDFVMADA